MYRLSSTSPISILLSLLFLTCLLFSPTNKIHAASITVNATCSLSDAITSANTDTATGGCVAGSGADTITLTGNITLSATLPNITSQITIAGASHSISGADRYRIFYVERNGDFTVNNLTLMNGRTNGEGGAIFNYGTLTVNNSISVITERSCVVARLSTKAHSLSTAALSTGIARRQQTVSAMAVQSKDGLGQIHRLPTALFMRTRLLDPVARSTITTDLPSRTARSSVTYPLPVLQFVPTAGPCGCVIASSAAIAVACL